ncbi:MAG: hypothetical protein JSV51_02140 [Candidatus Bathyarchaeota archaeon]|nr:MAG: hypothetical protein JSV51_02140 [Candidatus Bathyarchaeota archaeon]
MTDKIVERKLLLKRAFSQTKLFEIGKALNISYFRSFQSEWDINSDKAALEISTTVDNKRLKEIFVKYGPREWQVFNGQYYTFKDGELRLEGSWKTIQTAISQIKKKYGERCSDVLRCFIELDEGCGVEEIKQNLPEGTNPIPILSDLEELGVIVPSYKSKHLLEWVILEETSPIIRLELGLASKELERKMVTGVGIPKAEPEGEERRVIEGMDRELDNYLNDLLKYRVDRIALFGKSFSVASLADYLKDLFGPILYFDSLLSITQQYGLADVEIIHSGGRTGMQTGWNLSLFGEPGTGKSFSVRDIILGKTDAKVPPHGIPGRNRYAGGITPARFIRIGQAYSGRVFNFIIPEFNDWFKYKGMVEPLKLAMERGEIKYEMHREVIGPYHFTSFFSVNYNVAALGRGYEVTIQDPNFSAIEDRMLCRLHRLTKQRFVEIADSQMRLAFGEIDIEEGAQDIRDHLSLVYAAETEHPLVQDRFPPKPIMLTPKAQEMLMKVREAILNEIPREVVRFSARLEDRAIRFASAASLLTYFQSNLDYIPIDEEALRYALQLYIEEASVRSQDEFRPEAVLEKLSIA